MRLVLVFLIALSLVGCATKKESENNTEIEEIVEFDAKRANKGLVSYRFAKADGDYSELKVDEKLGIKSEDLVNTFNNFWVLEEIDNEEEVEIDDKDLLEEDILTYEDGKICNYIFYKQGIVVYSDNLGEKKKFFWKSNYIQ